MSTTVDVRFMEVVDWTGRQTVLLAPYGTPPILRDPGAWKDWARVVIGFPAVAALNPPRPEIFEDWRSWGRAFNVVLRLLTT